MKKILFDYLLVGVGVRILQAAIGDEVKKYLLKPMLKKIKAQFAKWFLKTEHDWAIFFHNVNKALDKNHKD